MSTSGILLFAAFLIGTSAFVLWPLFAKRSGKKANRDSQFDPNFDPTAQALEPLTQMQAEREGVLLALRDLDFDYQTGKFTEEDYQAQREVLLQRGVTLLQQIDAARSDAIEAAAKAGRG
jgi:hypothetical protein